MNSELNATSKTISQKFYPITSKESSDRNKSELTGIVNAKGHLTGESYIDSKSGRFE